MPEDDRRRQEARAALVAKFRAMALDRLRRLNLAFLELERNPAAAEVQQEALREIHTLKGEARLVGLADLSEAVHKTEEVVFHARRGGFRVGPAVHDALLAGLDLAAAMIAGQAPAEALPEYAARVDRLVGTGAEPQGDGAPLAGKDPKGGAEDPLLALGAGGREGWISVDLVKLDHLTNLLGDLVQDQARRERALRVLTDTAHVLRDEVRLAVSLVEKAGEEGADAEWSSLRHVLERQSALERVLRDFVGRARDETFDDGLRVAEAEAQLREMRMTPLSSLFSEYVRGARDLARDLGKRVRVEIKAEGVAADKRVLDQIAEPLLHLVRNAVDHGIESPEGRRAAGKSEEGHVLLQAAQAGGRLRVTVTDDGAGLDVEAIGRAGVAKGLLSDGERANASTERVVDLIFREGFSTRSEVGRVSGRGVGLDVVRHHVERLGGTMTVNSSRGRGTSFVLDVPLSLALIDVLLFEDRGVTYGLPTSCLDRVLTSESVTLLEVAGGTVFHLDGVTVPVGDMGSFLGVAGPVDESPRGRVLVLGHRGRKLGLRVSQVLGYRSLVQKDADGFLEGVSLLAGTAFLGEGAMALILEPSALLSTAGAAVRLVPRTAVPRRQPCILLVDDSEITRLLLAEIFQRLGYEVREAADGARALAAVADRSPDLILLDLDMPVMSGFGFLERMKAEGRPHVPVVVFSARGSDEDMRRSVALGVDAYLVKSRFQETDLVATIQRFLPSDLI